MLLLTKICILLFIILFVWGYQNFASKQLIEFKRRATGPIGTLTSDTGSPIEHQETFTLNKPLLHNRYFMESLTHVVREKLPERIIHAKGAGALGYFEVTHDLFDICKANLFIKVGQRTPVIARFSPLSLGKDAADTLLDARGFSLKFYTEKGNFDIVGLNTPVYGFKNPVYFVPFLRTFNKNPVTNLRDFNMLWDFITLQPRGLFMLLHILRGIHDGYRHMPGYSVQTYQVVNEHGEVNFVRFHFTPDAEVKTISIEEAIKLAGIDPDYATRDLYNAIANGDFPRWTMSVQVLSLEDMKHSEFDIFDVSKVLPLDKYPLREVGKIVLNKNSPNYFADIEQVAFSPANLIPGIMGGPDKFFEARILAYRDAQYHRLGANYNKIRVNCPRDNVFTYNRGGSHPVGNNMFDSPNYYPNSFDGPVPYVDENRLDLVEPKTDNKTNFNQISEMYSNEMTEDERSNMINNVVRLLKLAADHLQKRAVGILKIIHFDFGDRVEKGLQWKNTTNNTEV